jgi:uncharacterized membrane protein
MPKKSAAVPYENNPFTIAVSGMTLLFSLARGVAIFLLVLSIFSYYGGGWGPDKPIEQMQQDVYNTVSAWTAVEWSLAVGSVLVIGLAVLMIAALFGGVSAYTSAQIARGKQVKLTEAFRVAFENLWSFLWLNILIFVKVFLWSLLLIIPGIIMSVRYTLAGTAFYDDTKHLRGNAAIKESLRLTKGAWVTTFSSHLLFNFITLSVISDIITTSVNAQLYKQFDGNDKKPSSHWLSKVTLGLIIFMVIVGLPVLFLIASKAQELQ